MNDFFNVKVFSLLFFRGQLESFQARVIPL